MNQFFSGTKSGSSNNNDKKTDVFRLPLPNIGSVGNSTFSPASEQNFIMENMFGNNLQSPMSSVFQYLSPLDPTQGQVSPDMTAPVYLSNFSRFQAIQPSTVGSKDDFRMPNLPTYKDKGAIDITEPLINLSEGLKPTFQKFSNDSSHNLRSFLNDQLIKAGSDYNKELVVPISITPTPLYKVPRQALPSSLPQESLNKPIKTALVAPKVTPISAQSEHEFSSGPSTLVPSYAGTSIASKSPEQSPSYGQFETLIKMLLNIFTTNTLMRSDFDNLPPFERQILYHLLKRKFNLKGVYEINQNLDTISFTSLTKILSTQSSKRPEECYKFILTRVIKVLKHRYEKVFRTKAQVEAHLYEQFFKETSKTLSIPITEFHYPLTGSLKGKFKLNATYFARIFRSDAFVKEINTYCSDVLLNEYTNDINRKLVALFAKWSEDLSQATPSTLVDAQRAVIDYIKFNKRCKLPWTLLEVKESIEKFTKLMAGYVVSSVDHHSPSQEVSLLSPPIPSEPSEVPNLKRS